MGQALIPYPGGGGGGGALVVEMGTVRRVHGSKVGAVLGEKPGSTTLYYKACGLLFPTSRAAKKHLEDTRKGKRPKAKPQGKMDPQTNPPTDPKIDPRTDP